MNINWYKVIRIKDLTLIDLTDYLVKLVFFPYSLIQKKSACASFTISSSISLSFPLLFICQWFIIPLMVSPLSLIVNTAPNYFRPHAAAFLSPSSQSRHIFLVVTCSQIKSLCPSRSYYTPPGTGSYVGKPQLSASCSKCEEKHLWISSKKCFKCLKCFVDVLKHFIGTMLSTCCS